MQVQFLSIDSKSKGDNMIHQLACNGTSFSWFTSQIVSLFPLCGKLSSLICDLAIVRMFRILLWIFIAHIVKIIFYSSVDLSCHSDTSPILASQRCSGVDFTTMLIVTFFG